MVLKDSANIINKKLQTKENSTENFELFFSKLSKQTKKKFCKICITL